MSERLRTWLAAIAAILWLASFFLPAVRTGQGWQMGWQIAVIGWCGPLAGQFGWYANAIMIPSLGMLALGESPSDFDKMSKLAAVMFLFWINTLFWTEIPLDSGRQVILARGAGYYAWMASLLIVWGGLLVLDRRWSCNRRVEDGDAGSDDAQDQDQGAANATPVRSAAMTSIRTFRFRPRGYSARMTRSVRTAAARGISRSPR